LVDINGKQWRKKPCHLRTSHMRVMIMTWFTNLRLGLDVFIRNVRYVVIGGLYIDTDDSSGQSIIDKINDNHKFWEENIKEEYLDVINGYYNLLMFRIDYDSSDGSKIE
jgi:hypothetical protein